MRRSRGALLRDLIKLYESVQSQLLILLPLKLRGRKNHGNDRRVKF